MNRLQGHFKIGTFTFDVSPFHEYYNRPIRDYACVAGDRIYQSFQNGLKLMRYGVGMDVAIRLFDNFLQLKGSGEVARHKSQGQEYKHVLTSWYGYLQALFTYKNWQIGLGIDTPFQKEWGKHTQVLSAVASSDSWMRMSCSRICFLNLTWNMALGRKHPAARQRLHNKDTGGSGALRVQ